MALVTIILAEVHIPQSRSLKERRRVVRSLLERARSRLKVSAAETGHQDAHQRAELTFAYVTGDDRGERRVADALRSFFDDEMECVVTRWDSEILDTTTTGDDNGSWQ